MKFPSEDDIVYHLENSIESWVDPDDGSYWGVRGVAGENPYLTFVVSDEEGEEEKVFHITVKEATSQESNEKS